MRKAGSNVELRSRRRRGSREFVALAREDRQRGELAGTATPPPMDIQFDQCAKPGQTSSCDLGGVAVPASSSHWRERIDNAANSREPRRLRLWTSNSINAKSRVKRRVAISEASRFPRVRRIGERG